MTVLLPRLALAFGLLTLAGVSPAQAPKDKPAPAKAKPTAAETAQAETKLKAANCAISYEDLPPLAPNGPRQKGQADHVAFPRDVMDHDVARLVPLMQKLPALKIVDLGGCTHVTAKGFKEIAKLDTLKAVFLDGATVEHDGLFALSKIPTLQWLDLSRTTVTDTDLRDIGDFAGLMTLKLEGVPALTAAGVAHLGTIARLHTLHITVTADQAGMVAEISKLTKLSELKVYPVTDAETKDIAKLAALQVLDVNDPYVSRYGLRAARSRRVMPAAVPMPAAKVPAVAGKAPVRRGFATHEITAKGLETIATACTDLRVLKVAGHPVTLKDSAVAKLEFLTELDATGTDVDDAGAVALGKIKTLAKLHLSATNVTTAGVRELSLIGSLEELSADALPLTEEVIKYLSQNRKFKVLSLNNTRVDLSDRRAWGAFNRLERVSLENTNVTDSTIMALTKVPTLKFADVTMNCPNVTQEGAQALQREMPATRVWWYPCDMVFWPGGGGVPDIRVPDLKYRNPNQLPMKTPVVATNTKAPPAPPPAIRVIGGGLGSK